MSDCIFCTIASGAFGTEFYYEDENVVAFDDLHPQAPVHVLVVPKQHVSGLNDADTLPVETLTACLNACREIAASEGIAESGWRMVSNCGPDACQSVQHLHFHVLGGRKMADSMA